MALCINISKAADIPLADKNFTDGVGLFRTENFFMDKGDFPDEETQFEAYKDAAIKARSDTHDGLGRRQDAAYDKGDLSGRKSIYGLQSDSLLPG